MTENLSTDGPVPVIDLSPAVSSRTSADEVAQRLGEACETIGFVVVTGHDVDKDALGSIYDVCREYFSLSEEQKRLGAADPPNRFCGYTGPGDREGAAGSPPDLLEAFEASSFDSRAELLSAGYTEKWASQHLPNIWPPEPARMRDVWHRYMVEMRGFSCRLMHLAARALGLPDVWFDDKFDRAVSKLVANYYPPQMTPPAPGQLRQSAHTDFGGFTILYQDSDVGGLQVKTRDGQWLGVPVVNDSFVVNLGDLLAKWTNDRWVATEHRVVNPPIGAAGTARISIPFFDHPNRDALIEPISTCVSEEYPAKYPAVFAGNWSEFRMTNYSVAVGS